LECILTEKIKKVKWTSGFSLSWFAHCLILGVMNILAIESSADETSVAVVKDGQQILSNIIASQIDIHIKYGGIVPEVAARSHIEAILPVVEEALEAAGCSWDNIGAIAVTKGPGLMGALLIGVLTAQTLAVAKSKPLIGVNHIWAHAFAAFLTDSKPQFPFLALTVSGGHTTLSMYKEDLTREVLGETLDDAAGEAFDKVAKLLGLPYPGGPAIGKAAEHGNDQAYAFPIAKLGKDSLDFSFSGLKTAVLRQVQEITGVNPGAIDSQKTYELSEKTVANVAASFQKATVDALVKNTQKAFLRYGPKSVVVGGGVAANSLLRSEMLQAVPSAIFVPPVLCTDNAAMIAALAFQMTEKGKFTKPTNLSADSSLEEN
jgi:N6-L-threonylcarbamoyladenine synthase